ncbi:MAG: 3-oxoacyl-ACP reductase [Geminicoccus sp.]|nr:3-oxoacyl-ACP reductase [Geminicoccus sp.]
MSTIGLSGQRVCVTGASRGIGAHACEVFARDGAQVLGIARSRDELADLRERLTEQGLAYDFATLDLTAPDAGKQLEALFTGFVPDVFVNNAGATKPAPFQDVSREDFDRVMELNVRAGFFSTQAAVRAMIANPASASRAIIHLGSMLGHVALPERSVYAATKHALEGLTKAMALDLAPHGIRVNALAPTYIETPLTEPLLTDPAFRKFVSDRMPMSTPERPIGELRDLDGALLFLADSSRSGLVSGTSVVVDGGWTAQ